MEASLAEKKECSQAADGGKEPAPSAAKADSSEHPESNKVHAGRQAALSPQTQQTIMEIIQTLRNNTTPDTAHQLFKTLSETSAAVERTNKEARKGKEGEDSPGRVAPALGPDQQLKLLLENLSANESLNRKAANEIDRRHASDKAAQSQGGAGGAAGAHGQLITHAYHLINEVIMYPQIMWTRNFFYSLGAMVPQQQ